MSKDQDDRTYQRRLIAEVDAEMGRRRMSRRELSRLTGIHRVQLDRIFLLQRDLNVAQWATICAALDVDPAAMALRAQLADRTHRSAAHRIESDPRLNDRQKREQVALLGELYTESGDVQAGDGDLESPDGARGGDATG